MTMFLPTTNYCWNYKLVNKTTIILLFQKYFAIHANKPKIYVTKKLIV